MDCTRNSSWWQLPPCFKFRSQKRRLTISSLVRVWGVNKHLCLLQSPGPRVGLCQPGRETPRRPHWRPPPRVTGLADDLHPGSQALLMTSTKDRSLAALVHLGWLILCHGGCPVHCWPLSSIPGLYPLDVRSNTTTAVLHSPSHVQLFATPWAVARQASLSFTIS